MEVIYSPEAELKLNEVPDEVADKIRSRIKELKSGPSSHKRVKLIEVEGKALFRLKIGNRNQKFDHRAIFDIEDEKINILSIIDRIDGYNNISDNLGSY